MKLSIKSDYGVRAVFGLSRHYGTGKAFRVEKLAREQNIPANYLVQILLELKNQGIVTSQRGKDGGYLLAKSPSEVSFGDVLRCIHGAIFEAPAMNDSNVHQAVKNSWIKLQKQLDETANEMTFDKLIAVADNDQEMYYI